MWSLSSIKTPRFLAVFEGVMVDEPNWKVKLWWNDGFAETTSSSVLARLIWRWWSFIQQEMSAKLAILGTCRVYIHLYLFVYGYITKGSSHNMHRPHEVTIICAWLAHTWLIIILHSCAIRIICRYDLPSRKLDMNSFRKAYIIWPISD